MHVNGTLWLEVDQLSGGSPRVWPLARVRGVQEVTGTRGGLPSPHTSKGTRMRLPRFVRQKIARKYQTAKIVLGILLGGLLLFLSAGLRAG